MLSSKPKHRPSSKLKHKPKHKRKRKHRPKRKLNSNSNNSSISRCSKFNTTKDNRLCRMSIQATSSPLSLLARVRRKPHLGRSTLAVSAAVPSIAAKHLRYIYVYTPETKA